jgi:hypothetical protein
MPGTEAGRPSGSEGDVDLGLTTARWPPAAHPVEVLDLAVGVIADRHARQRTTPRHAVGHALLRDDPPRAPHQAREDRRTRARDVTDVYAEALSSSPQFGGDVTCSQLVPSRERAALDLDPSLPLREVEVWQVPTVGCLESFRLVLPPDVQPIEEHCPSSFEP